MKEMAISVQGFRKLYGKHRCRVGCRLRGAARRDLRAARAERRRQDQHAGVPGRHSPARWRHAATSWASTPAASRPSCSNLIGVQLQTSGLPADYDRWTRRCASSAPITASRRATTCWTGWAGTKSGRQYQPALHRPAAPPGAGAGRRPPAAGGLPGRADRRAGRRLARRAARPDGRSWSDAGAHDHPGHARYGRGGEDGRPRRDPAARQDRRHRHATRADRHRRRLHQGLRAHRTIVLAAERRGFSRRAASSRSRTTTQSTSAPTRARPSRRSSITSWPRATS